jgi:hypothetical protein
LLDSTNTGILRVVYPERNTKILRFAQDDSERAQNDTAQRFFINLLEGLLLMARRADFLQVLGHLPGIGSVGSQLEVGLKLLAGARELARAF